VFAITRRGVPIAKLTPISFKENEMVLHFYFPLPYIFSFSTSTVAHCQKSIGKK